MLYLKIKKCFDRTLSIVTMLILSPLFIILLITIKLDSRGPVLFKQKRVGIHKSHFYIYKFRTMRIDTPKDTPTHLLENPEQWITKVGKFLRRTSLDELPQILNICKGEMSFIGPRPALWNQYNLIKERDKYGANDVLPGLTGWAQINGRDELPIKDKAKLDGEYVKKMGIIMDIICFFGTVISVVKHDGVVEGGTGKMHKEGVEHKKVLFLANHFITLYSFRKELIQKLCEEGHEVYLSLPEDDDNKYFEDISCEIIITEIDRRGVNPLKDLKLIRYYKKIIREIKPDIIFSFTIKPNIYGSLVTNRKYKQVCNVTGTGATFLEKTLVSRICMFLYKISVKQCYKVYFQNTGDMDFFVENHMVKNNYEMLPGSGVNLVQFASKPYPTEDDNIKFIFIGRVMKLKGIDEYLEAAKNIKENYPDTTFYIAGWNEEEGYKKIVADYQEKGIVDYIGFQDNISEWIQKCHCTVLPSHGGEGVPNVLLESAASGRVCIGSKIYGTEDVIDEGTTGYLFVKENADSLTAAINQFMKMSMNEREAMGIAGREKVEREFDRNIVIRKYCDEVRRA